MAKGWACHCWHLAKTLVEYACVCVFFGELKDFIVKGPYSIFTQFWKQGELYNPLTQKLNLLDFIFSFTFCNPCL